jgi:hypothetical protein
MKNREFWLGVLGGVVGGYFSYNIFLSSSDISLPVSCPLNFCIKSPM